MGVFFIIDDKRRLYVLYEIISVFKILLINIMYFSVNLCFFVLKFVLNIKVIKK